MGRFGRFSVRKALTLPLMSLACIAALTLATPARADFTFPTFNFIATDDFNNGSFELTGAPADVYTSFTLTLDWSAIAGDPWSEEALFGLVSGPAPFQGGYTIYRDLTAAANGSPNGDPVTLTFEGFLETPYNGGDPLHFYGVQSFGGSSAAWENIVLTLGAEVAVAPDAMEVSDPSSHKVDLGAGEVAWFRFDYAGGPLVIDTLGSSLLTGNDTELGLFNSTGTLLALNDDIDFVGGNLLSRLSFLDGDLAPGTYYVALGAFNTAYDDGFSATSTSSFSGVAFLNINATVPEPGTLAFLAGGLLTLATTARSIGRRKG